MSCNVAEEAVSDSKIAEAVTGHHKFLDSWMTDVVECLERVFVGHFVKKLSEKVGILNCLIRTLER